MSQVWWYALSSVFLISITSFAGLFFLFVKEKSLERINNVFVSIAVGSLLGDAFIHLIPESFEKNPNALYVSLLILGSIFLFFSFEKFLHWRHEHHPEHIHPVGYINLVADAVHNFIDGALIGAAYLTSIPIGIATTIAVFLHEIPQEIGEFGILIHAGFTKKKALLLNIASAGLSLVGVILVLLLGGVAEHLEQWVLPIIAGAFIYISGSDLIPELHKEQKMGKSFVQLLAMLSGSALMYLLLYLD